MLKSAVTGYAFKKGAKVLPGGWVTVALLHPRSRAVGMAAARHGWRQVQKRRGR